MIPKVITIAGSDSSGGAGIQADLKTFQEYGVFGFSAITSLVTMNPDEGWSHTVTSLQADIVEAELKTIYAGAPLAALKTGMLGELETIRLTRRYIEAFKQQNVVIDPVMACKGTSDLLQPENVALMTELLLPVATITTPNLIEAGILSGLGELKSVSDMEAAAKKIMNLGVKNVVIKGGKRLAGQDALDLFYDGQAFTYLNNEKYDTDFNHGAGCTFAAAITAGLAKGYSVKDAVILAKKFVAASIKHGLEINPYLGHVWHGAYNQADKRMPLV
ncbi:bifunctional hydroxymethylpyrimidine kinase/phosphomethylpyrimidine kinase [Vagococcus intermedius]|uniref:pyridoxal kinase n=1 Tax=Vagococcus intermedius TaxID=2991418 RepID=A0AAF0CW29_9ENTE|nr:bifunctional hydroxymethylpyrimidine kinase/phosphomethylpyrimidine kinase [Vagococcus intermedius]WEG73902.1 bifunctional hydroxymethylpyrimidine kinase/phosphomethylpyrimidine kinase [Vagococcus intermedius]WEG75986.1 bifunctional hydroxymethylpyrimidine kinase/phosphomethylpyrimidine kinase [Vagococcus intermedius]